MPVGAKQSEGVNALPVAPQNVLVAIAFAIWRNSVCPPIPRVAFCRLPNG